MEHVSADAAAIAASNLALAHLTAIRDGERSIAPGFNQTVDGVKSLYRLYHEAIVSGAIHEGPKTKATPG